MSKNLTWKDYGKSIKITPKTEKEAVMFRTAFMPMMCKNGKWFYGKRVWVDAKRYEKKIIREFRKARPK